MNGIVLIRRFGSCDYSDTYRAMKTLTLERGKDSPDEIWVLGGRWSGVGELATVEIYNPTNKMPSF